MYMTNEEWEQNNQDYLKESYEETGFTTGGYAIRKLICGGCGRVFYTTIYTKKYCHSYWCGNQANNLRQREYRQMRRQDLVCQCCGEKFTPKRADARYCSNSCRQKVYRKRVTDAASTQNEHIVFHNACHPVSAARLSSEVSQNAVRLNLEPTNNIYLPGGRRVRGFMGIEALVHPAA